MSQRGGPSGQGSLRTLSGSYPRPEQKNQATFGTRTLGAGKGHLAGGSQNHETRRDLSHHLLHSVPAPRPRPPAPLRAVEESKSQGGPQRKKPRPELGNLHSSPAGGHSRSHTLPSPVTCSAVPGPAHLAGQTRRATHTPVAETRIRVSQFQAQDYLLTVQPLPSLTAGLSWIFARDPGERGGQNRGEGACTLTFQGVVSPREDRGRDRESKGGWGLGWTRAGPVCVWGSLDFHHLVMLVGRGPCHHP